VCGGCRASRAGELVSALAITEPGVGSDMKAMSTRALRHGDHYVVNGAKTFISNGPRCRSRDPRGQDRSGRGPPRISHARRRADTPGFERGRKLEKIGLRAQDLAELSFTDMAVPCENLLGEENHGFEYLSSHLPQERLSIGWGSQAAAARSARARPERGSCAERRAWLPHKSRSSRSQRAKPRSRPVRP